MKSFLDLAKRRKTIFKFSDKKVSNQNIKKMLEAARWSPSCRNSQPWHFIVVRDKKKIEELMKESTYGFYHNNPSVLIACVLIRDKCEGEDFSCFKGRYSGTYESFITVGIAAYNICLEAFDLGVGSCLLTPHQPGVRKILNISDEDMIPMLVGLGYESKSAPKRKRTRVPMKEIVSYDSFI